LNKSVGIFDLIYYNITFFITIFVEKIYIQRKFFNDFSSFLAYFHHFWPTPFFNIRSFWKNCYQGITDIRYFLQFYIKNIHRKNNKSVFFFVHPAFSSIFKTLWRSLNLSPKFPAIYIFNPFIYFRKLNVKNSILQY